MEGLASGCGVLTSTSNQTLPLQRSLKEPLRDTGQGEIAHCLFTGLTGSATCLGLTLPPPLPHVPELCDYGYTLHILCLGFFYLPVGLITSLFFLLQKMEPRASYVMRFLLLSHVPSY